MISCWKVEKICIPQMSLYSSYMRIRCVSNLVLLYLPNPFMPSGFFYLNSLDKTIFNLKSVWSGFLGFFFYNVLKYKFLCLMQTVCGVWSGSAILPMSLFWDARPGWSGGAKVLCILHHWGVQLILAYSSARPAILVVGKGRGGMFLFLLFLHFHSCSSFFPVPLFHLLYSLFYLFSPFLWETTQNDPQGLTCR